MARVVIISTNTAPITNVEIGEEIVQFAVTDPTGVPNPQNRPFANFSMLNPLDSLL